MGKKVDVQRLMKERRIRVIYVRPEELLHEFNLIHHAPTQSLVWAYDLPDDCILKDVRYDCKMAVFEFYILSAKFDIVELGAVAPQHRGMMHRVVVNSEMFDPETFYGVSN